MRTTMDYAVAIVLLGALAIGLGSMLLGKIVELWDALVSRVSRGKSMRSVELTSQTSRQTVQTDRSVQPPSVIPPKPPRLAVDRTRAAVMEELLTNGWTVAELRREGIFRGDNATIGKEVSEMRARFGLSDPDRTLKIRDEKGERVIPA